MPANPNQSYIGRVPKSAYAAFGLAAFAFILAFANPQLVTVGGTGVLAIVIGIRELQKCRLEIEGDRVSITGRTTFGAFGKPTVVIKRADISRIEQKGDDLRVYYQRAGKEKKIDYLSLDSQQQYDIYQQLT